MERRNASNAIQSNNFALERLNSNEEFSREWMITGMVYYT